MSSPNHENAPPLVFATVPNSPTPTRARVGSKEMARVETQGVRLELGAEGEEAVGGAAQRR